MGADSPHYDILECSHRSAARAHGDESIACQEATSIRTYKLKASAVIVIPINPVANKEIMYNTEALGLGFLSERIVLRRARPKERQKQ